MLFVTLAYVARHGAVLSNTVNDFCLQTRDLSHYFSVDDRVLAAINLQVPAGSIYGFLGPNGAGKTTTLRLVLGLLKKQAGDICFFGKPFGAHRREILRNVGSLIESPSVYAHLTAVENLTLLRKIYGCSHARIPEVLELVGLAHTGPKQAGRFSLGMKQRLAIAMSLLHEPSLLVLDEPTNGLDPNGIIEMRALLKKLNREKNITILISSHLLSEIEKLVTHLGIIHRGRMVFQGTMDDLHELQEQSTGFVLETGDPEKTAQIISGQKLRFGREGDSVRIYAASRENIATINQLLVNAQVPVYGITPSRGDLEAMFMELINGSQG